MDNSEENPKKAQKDLFYKQQQQRLQSVTIKSNNLTADDLIKNILEKVDSDAKISKLNIGVPQQRHSQPATASHHHSVRSSHESIAQVDSSQSATCLPVPPCFLRCSEIPAIYQHVWNAAKQEDANAQAADLCDRDKLYQVLLLSHLPSHILAQLWAYVNRTIPGQLTKGELFVMLALIALIQCNSQDPVNELYKAASIPLPQFPQLAPPESNPFRERVQFPLETAPILLTSQPTLTEHLTSFSNEDDFADFKSAAEPSESELENNKANLYSDSAGTETEMKHEIKDENAHNSIDAFDAFGLPSLDVQENKSADVVGTSPTSEMAIQCDAISKPQSLTPQADSSILKVEHSDRYRSLRSLTTSATNTTSLSDSEEFGDFYSHSTNDCDRSPEDDLTGNFIGLRDKAEMNPLAVSNKRKTLQSICRVMQRTFNILIVNHGEESVIEALGSKDGANFASDLGEVFAIAQRINGNVSVLNDPSEANMCNSLFDEISNKWNLIFRLFCKSTPNFKSSDSLPASTSDASLSPSSHQWCRICSDLCQPTNSLMFAGFHYHSSCANFWLNTVDSSLPHRHYEDF